MSKYLTLIFFLVVSTGSIKNSTAQPSTGANEELKESWAREVRVCTQSILRGVRKPQDSRNKRFTGKAENDFLKECLGGAKMLTQEDVSWVDWPNYYGTRDKLSEGNRALGWLKTTFLYNPIKRLVSRLTRDLRGVYGALTDLEYQRVELIKHNLFDNKTFKQYIEGNDDVTGRTIKTWSEMRLLDGTDSGELEHIHFKDLDINDLHVNGSDSKETCTGSLVRFRTTTGICNDIDNPAMGSTGQLFGRNVQFEETFPLISGAELSKARHDHDPGLTWDTPDPYEISRRLFSRKNPDSCNNGYGLPPGTHNAADSHCPYEEATWFNVLAAFWIQFMTHDWFSHLANGRNDDSASMPECESKYGNGDDSWKQLVKDITKLPNHSMGAAHVAQCGSPEPFTSQEDGKEYWPRAHRTSQNHVTAWWDASQIYGFDNASRARVMRDPNDRAKLTVASDINKSRPGDNFGYLPTFEHCEDGAAACDLQPEWRGQEAVAFPDNWSVGLSFFHNVFMREHNIFVDSFRRVMKLDEETTSKNGPGSKGKCMNSGLRNPEFPKEIICYKDISDDELFEIARLVVSAEIAKIHTIEWTTQLLYNEPLYLGLNSNWSGLFTDSDLDPRLIKILKSKLRKLVSLLAKSEDEKRRNDWYSVLESGAGIVRTGTEPAGGYNFGSCHIKHVRKDGTVDCGSINLGTNHFGSPFNFPEEFVSVYRLHPMLPDLIEFRNLKANPNVIQEKIPLVNTFRGMATKEMRSRNLSDWALSMGRQRLGTLTLNNSPRFLQNLPVGRDGRFDDAGKTLDVVALDIIRDRERGIPRFNEFRRQIGLKSLTSFAEFVGRPRLSDPKPCKTSEEKRNLECILRDIYGTHVCDVNKEISHALIGDDQKPINDCLGYPDKTRVDNIEDLDTIVGWLAEPARPHGFAISETQFQVFILNASRRLFSDRFFTSSYSPKFYTQFGLDWVDNNGPGAKQLEAGEPNGHERQEILPLKRVLLRTMPELRNELVHVVNAFDPWSRDRGEYYSTEWKPRPDAINDDSYSDHQVDVEPGTGWSENLTDKEKRKEAEKIVRHARNIKKAQDTLRKKMRSPEFARAQHAKMLAGFSNAIFRVAPDIPKDLQIDFLIPGETYPAIVRFSNASGFKVENDSERDLRGAAVQIMLESERTHDFLMTNAERHHARNATEVMDTTLALGTKKSNIAQAIVGIPELVFRAGPKDAFRIARTLRKQTGTYVESLATETFWSRAPFQFGKIALKYKLEPMEWKLSVEEPAENLGRKTLNIRKTPSSLRQELAKRLDEGDVKYTLKFQRYANEYNPDHSNGQWTTPIDDPTQVWNTPWETIAEVIIPKQIMDAEPTSKEEKSVDLIRFNPRQVANDEEFKLLGNMNRARYSVYKGSQERRPREK